MMINCLLLLCYYGKLPVANITESINQQCNRDKPIKWTELTAADHALVHIALVPSSSPLIVIGGEDSLVKGSIPTAGIKMYDNSNNSWRQ